MSRRVAGLYATECCESAMCMQGSLPIPVPRLDMPHSFLMVKMASPSVVGTGPKVCSTRGSVSPLSDTTYRQVVSRWVSFGRVQAVARVCLRDPSFVASTLNLTTGGGPAS